MSPDQFVDREMLRDASCALESCGCSAQSFSTSQKCPLCGGRLRAIGRPQSLRFRLTCRDCGYQSNLLSQEEIEQLL